MCELRRSASREGVASPSLLRVEKTASPSLGALELRRCASQRRTPASRERVEKKCESTS